MLVAASDEVLTAAQILVGNKPTPVTAREALLQNLFLVGGTQRRQHAVSCTACLAEIGLAFHPAITSPPHQPGRL